MGAWWSGRLLEMAMEAASGRGKGPTGTVAIDLQGTVHIGRCTTDNRVEAIIAARMTAEPPDGGPPPRGVTPGVAGRIVVPHGYGRAALSLTESGFTQLPLGVADPFVWLQLIDDRGAPVTEEACLGHGVDLQCRFHADASLGVRCAVTLVPPFGPHTSARKIRPGVHEVTVRGLYARLVLRTYGSDVGPRFQTEVVMIPLLETGHRLRFHAAPFDARLEAATSGPGPTRAAVGDSTPIE
jgi:hypothetical protein